ncbi:putative peroxidase [Medicago truncatula]|uniref:Peroxidase n=1 Tax=Medicago truncatula TaxID=3880 RepID=G7J2Y6_MEDTR|nr:peroxidase P7 [Medicago truncatula]AES71279.1 peroxidase family protein [Medicago truncatula]RHN68488.1 putative peroxidase [Medicago truncatula]
MASYYFLLFVLVAASAISEADAKKKLSKDFYCSSCPELLSIVNQGVINAIKKETRIGASLLRLHFHDCFVNGCDASILLDDTSSFIGEKTAAANNNSARGFNVIDDIKANVEKACPGVVSCADILTLAARDSVVHLGGPSWNVGLGRRDSITASRSDANNSIPAPFLNLSALKTNFANQGLSAKDLVALSGAHTIGLARCVQFRAHIYNDSNVDSLFRKSLQNKCPRSGNDNVLEPLDHQTPTHFDNLYFKNLLAKKALLHSDQELFNGSSTDNLVRKYATDNAKFFKAFAKGMVKMSSIKPLTGSNGQIRTNCRKIN